MDSKVVGFFGSDSYDLVHFLARVLQQLGKRVLIADRTEDKVMMLTVPVAEAAPIVDYRGIAFTGEPVDVVNSEYDYIFLYYGFDCQQISEVIEESYFVTDCQMQSIQKLKHLTLQENQFRALVIRNSVPERDIMNYVNLELEHLEFGEENVYTLPFNQADISAMLAVQYDSVYKFDYVSKPTMDFIVGFCSLDFPEKDVVTALRVVAKAGGGKK